MKPRTLALLSSLLSLSSLQPAFAEKADREKPVNLEADKITVDDAKKLHILEGAVQLVRGTLVIRTEKLTVSQDADGFQKGTAFGGAGGLARFRQKREGKEEYVDGEAERIEHDARTEKTEFFGRAAVKSGLDEVRGQYISYDGRTENFLVTSGGGASGKQERVRAVIQPKNSDSRPAAGSAVPALRQSLDIAAPRQE